MIPELYLNFHELLQKSYINIFEVGSPNCYNFVVKKSIFLTYCQISVVSNEKTHLMFMHLWKAIDHTILLAISNFWYTFSPLTVTVL